MQILLTNDDGIFAPGLAAMERRLRGLGEVSVVAPSTEQSGVGHAITFLTPLTAKEVFDGDRRRGWAVDGSPADAVKLGISEFCLRRPDLVVSGINIAQRHTKPSQGDPQGGIQNKEAPLHVSNVAIVDSNGKPTRVGFRIDGDKKVRVAKTTGEVING